jgi:hypothetical protein
LAGLFAAAQGLATIYRKIFDEQTTLGAQDRLMAFEEFNELMGVDAKYALAEQYGVRG